MDNNQSLLDRISQKHDNIVKASREYRESVGIDEEGDPPRCEFGDIFQEWGEVRGSAYALRSSQ